MAKIVRMMAVYNEMDVLPQNIDWYCRAGFRTVVVDNGSTDGSYEYCRAAWSRGEIDALNRIPTEDHEWSTLLARLCELAQAQQPAWLMLTAPDEFFETATGEDLRAAMEADIEAGYNLIKFYNMEFWMTEKDDPADPDPLTRIRHYSCYDVDMYRAYPNVAGIDIVRNLSHRPVFPDGIPDRPSPRLYVSRHYKLRTIEQASRKIRRIRPSRKEPHHHTHYLNFKDPGDFVVPAHRLHRYDFDHCWNFDSVYDGKRGLLLVTRLPPA